MNIYDLISIRHCLHILSGERLESIQFSLHVQRQNDLQWKSLNVHHLILKVIDYIIIHALDAQTNLKIRISEIRMIRIRLTNKRQDIAFLKRPLDPTSRTKQQKQNTSTYEFLCLFKRTSFKKTYSFKRHETFKKVLITVINLSFWKDMNKHFGRRSDCS